MPKMQVSRKRKAYKSRVPRSLSAAPWNEPRTPTHIPQIDVQSIVYEPLRWMTKLNTGAALTVTGINLFDSINVPVGGGLKPLQMYDSVRIRRVTVWAPIFANAANAVAVTVNLVFNGSAPGVQGNDLTFADTTMNVSVPACVSVKPPRESLVSKWIPSTTTGALFTIIGQNHLAALGLPIGSIIEVLCQFRNDPTTLPIACANNNVSGSAGDKCYRGLDGLAIAGTSFPPIAQPQN